MTRSGELLIERNLVASFALASLRSSSVLAFFHIPQKGDDFAFMIIERQVPKETCFQAAIESCAPRSTTEGYDWGFGTSGGRPRLCWVAF